MFFFSCLLCHSALLSLQKATLPHYLAKRVTVVLSFDWLGCLLLAAGWRLAADSQQLTASELNTNFPCFVFKPPVVISNRISDLEASLSNRIASNDTGESICCF